jgi:hypothetical protein
MRKIFSNALPFMLLELHPGNEIIIIVKKVLTS